MFKKIEDAWSKIPSTTNELKDFALVMGVVIVVIGFIQQGIKLNFVWNNLVIVGLIILAIGIFMPKLLRPVQKAWMLFGLGLNFIMSSVILLLIYILVFLPTGLILKLMKKKLMDEIDPSLSSYWLKRSKILRKQEYYQKQF